MNSLFLDSLWQINKQHKQVERKAVNRTVLEPELAFLFAGLTQENGNYYSGIVDSKTSRKPSERTAIMHAIYLEKSDAPISSAAQPQT